MPPALVADIGGGSLPGGDQYPAGAAPARAHRAGLPSRHRDGRRDVHVRLAMRSATGFATGRFPGPAATRLTGGSPRYQLYPTADGKLVACGALEQKFWLAFCQAIGLAAEFVDDARDPAATKARGRRDHCRPHRGGMAADLRRRPIAARPSSRRSMKPCAIRISSHADCSRHQVAGPSGAAHAGVAGADRTGVSRAQRIGEAGAGTRRRRGY